ncbi:MAG TPA: trypsin-like peptidase domain-containing protein, partial [Planctomycetota bacterium]|nr:trypsin-like peptidase domain-containing protein [Planctomycetota bacterium]
MHRLLLPAGLLLAGLVAFDSAFDQHLRLVELERASVCQPEELTRLRRLLQGEQAAWKASAEASMAEEHELELAASRSASERIAQLTELLDAQQLALDTEQRRLAEWERDWDGMDSATLRRRLFELQARLEGQRADFDQLLTQREADRVRTTSDVHSLETRLERSLAADDPDKLWKDLVGPVVQLIGDSTVGSGVLLESRPLPEGGYATHVLTAWHVVRDILGAPDNSAAPVPTKIYSPDGSWRNLTARLLAHDTVLDLALLVLDTNEEQPCGARLATRAELDLLRTFDGVYAVGCPLGNDPIPTVGEVASTHHEVSGAKYWMISAPTYIGNSGGGIYAARTHDLIGIFSKIYTHGSTRSTIV